MRLGKEGGVEPCVNHREGVDEDWRTAPRRLREIVFQHDSVTRFARHQVLEGVVALAHREVLGDRFDPVASAELQHRARRCRRTERRPRDTLLAADHRKRRRRDGEPSKNKRPVRFAAHAT